MIDTPNLLRGTPNSQTDGCGGNSDLSRHTLCTPPRCRRLANPADVDVSAAHSSSKLT
jgi:hypothetical protein